MCDTTGQAFPFIMTLPIRFISRQGRSCLLGTVFLGFWCLNTTVSAEQEKIPTDEINVTQKQATPSGIETKTDKKQDISPQEAEKNAALDMREKEMALERLQRTRECSSEELRLKKSIAGEKLTNAKEDLQFFQNIDKERAIATAKLQLTRAHDQYEYKMEELNQLKQMYTEDQLTDTSEEVVLKRCVRETEDAKFEHDGKVATTQFEIDVKIPRMEQDLKNAVATAQNEHKRAAMEEELSAREQGLALDKARAALEKAKTSWEHKKKELTNSH